LQTLPNLRLANERLRCQPLELGNPRRQLEQSEFEAFDELYHEDKNQEYRVKTGSVVISSSCMDRPRVRKRFLEMKRLGLCARQMLEDPDMLPRS
jgi:hypothetical protein